MRISDYLDQRLVVFLEDETQNDAIVHMVDQLDKQGYLPNKEVFLKAIFEREALVSTGIGMGVAVPHAKLPEFEDFFIAIGIQKKQGIEWNAIDRAPVRLIFMIGGPDSKQSEYLQILSLLTQAIKDASLRKKLLSATSTEEIYDLFFQ